ncbi:MAG: hypothetical protein QNJ89_10250, partial [Acidimicrobiia bacterium]|nr:hypothetical protein [Acidimicrobiia bacterium]
SPSRLRWAWIRGSPPWSPTTSVHAQARGGGWMARFALSAMCRPVGSKYLAPKRELGATPRPYGYFIDSSASHNAT